MEVFGVLCRAYVRVFCVFERGRSALNYDVSPEKCAGEVFRTTNVRFGERHRVLP